MKRHLLLPFFLSVCVLLLSGPPYCLAAGEKVQAIQNDFSKIEKVMHFAEGLAGAYINGKWGFINAAGKTVIAPVFEEVLSFRQNYAAACIEKRWGFIDKKGIFVINPNYEGARSFSEGLAPVRKGKSWGYIDEKGRLVLDYAYEDLKGFNKGLAPAKRAGKWGFIDKSGAYKLSRDWLDAGEFSDGKAPVKNLENQWGYINSKGKFVIAAQFDEATPFAGGLAAVRIESKWGYIDTKGKFVINPEYEVARPFAQKLAAVKMDGKWGFVNAKGKTAVSFTFDDASNFADGLALVSQGGESFYIDTQGKRSLKVSVKKGLGSNPEKGIYVDAATPQNIIVINYSAHDLTIQNSTKTAFPSSIPAGKTYTDLAIGKPLSGSMTFYFANSKDIFNIWFWSYEHVYSWAIFQGGSGTFVGGNDWVANNNGRRYATNLAGIMNAYTYVSPEHTVTLYRVDLATLVVVINETDPGYPFKAPACSFWNGIY